MTEETKRKRGPRGLVGDGKPGRNFRRTMYGVVHLRAVAMLSAAGRAWLARKRGR